MVYIYPYNRVLMVELCDRAGTAKDVRADHAMTTSITRRSLYMIVAMVNYLCITGKINDR